MNLTTTLHCKTFHLRDPKDKAAYDALGVQLRANGLKPMVVGHMTGASDPNGAKYRNRMHDLDGREITLETEFLFGDQWNTAPIGDGPGLRVFDWQDSSIFDVKRVRTVQWLDVTDEMRAIRNDTLKCGYCGAMVRPGAPVPEDGFCTKCIDSQYLEVDTLHLLRLRPVSAEGDRPKLSEAEREALLPRYREAQLHGSTERGKARIAKAKQEIEDRYTKTLAKALIRRDGDRWIVANMPQLLRNAIYYDHTGRWCFGWDKPLNADQLSQLLDVVSEFPFPYDIKVDDGRTLSGER